MVKTARTLADVEADIARTKEAGSLQKAFPGRKRSFLQFDE